VYIYTGALSLDKEDKRLCTLHVSCRALAVTVALCIYTGALSVENEDKCLCTLHVSRRALAVTVVLCVYIRGH
jgi:hypothetical protein